MTPTQAFSTWKRINGRDPASSPNRVNHLLTGPAPARTDGVRSGQRNEPPGQAANCVVSIAAHCHVPQERAAWGRSMTGRCRIHARNAARADNLIGHLASLSAALDSRASGIVVAVLRGESRFAPSCAEWPRGSPARAPRCAELGSLPRVKNLGGPVAPLGGFHSPGESKAPCRRCAERQLRSPAKSRGDHSAWRKFRRRERRLRG